MGNNAGVGAAFAEIGKSIKKYGDIMAERQKIMALILSNQLSAQQNWFYKQQEMEKEHQNRIREKTTLNPLETQQLEYQKKLGEQTIPTTQSQPEVRMGTKGYEVNYPTTQERIIDKVVATGVESLRPGELAIYNGVIKRRIPTNANYDPSMTQKVINNIKTEEDYDEIIKNSKQYEKAGVNVAEVIKTHLSNPMVRNNPGLLSKIGSFFKSLLLGQ